MASCRGKVPAFQKSNRKKKVVLACIIAVLMIGIVNRHRFKATEDLPAIELYPAAPESLPRDIMPLQPTQTVSTPVYKRYVHLENSTPNSKYSEPETTPKPEGTEKLIQNRRELVRSACVANNETYEVYKKKTLISRRHNFLYCPVEKVASTFWRRFIYQLERTDLEKSPFEVSVRKIYGSEDIWSPFTLREKEDPRLLLNNSTKLIFVRDPYSRLLSAYVDKLLAPNPVFWNSWGKKSVTSFRTIHPFSEPGCGEDATFSEFISFTLSTTWKTDVHVMPIYKQCSPCFLNYTVIGKMETFQNDASHLLSLLNITNGRKYLDEMAQMKTLDAIEDSVSDAFSDSWMNKTVTCISKDEAARRIWRKLQIRGVISWRSHYNLDPNTVENMSGSEFIDIIKRTLQDSETYPRELKVQKRQAYMEAFSYLTESQLTEIADIFHSDLKMFDYEELTSESLKGVKITGAFDLTKDWDLGGVL